MSAFIYLRKLLEKRLEPRALKWFRSASGDIAEGMSDNGFCQLISLASRHARGSMLAPDEKDLTAATKLLEGWNPERWTLLEALRVGLILSRDDLAEESGMCAIDEAFRFADEGEACALYRSLALMPKSERFAWRAGEGCRTNMRSVFEAVALDTPYPVQKFDDVAWRQAVIKCVFIEAPLWRMYGLDTRLDAELARMALDLADERRSAGRPVQPELWICLGEHSQERGIASLERELEPGNSHLGGRLAAAYALGRAHAKDTIDRLLEIEMEPAVRAALSRAREEAVPQTVFADLDPKPLPTTN